MTVLIIDDVCSLKCPYCFYSTKLGKIRDKLIAQGKVPKNEVYMSRGLVKKVVQKIGDFQQLVTTKLWPNTIAISWGEPTLHPEFIDICKEFLKRWINIHLLSNFTFSPEGETAKFLKKNIDRFEFLVNLNEKKFVNDVVYKWTIQNLKNLDTEKMKISINIFHTEFDFWPLFEVLNATQKTYIVRFGVPNPEINSWINESIVKDIGNIKSKYEKQLLEDDLAYIDKTGHMLPYGLDEKQVNSHYKKLGEEISIMVSLIKKEWMEERVKFYIDCWFPYDIIPDAALWFVLQRVYYKNPCSIPNGDTFVDWSTSTCYTLQQWWNFWNSPNINQHSFGQISKYYLLSTLFLVNGLLKINLNRDICAAYAVRLFYQLFTDWKDWKFPLWDDIIKYECTNYEMITQKYLKLYPQKSIALTRIYQLIEFLLSQNEFEKVGKILDLLQTKIDFFKSDSTQYLFRYHYYKIIAMFLSEISQIKAQDDEELRKKYMKRLEDLRKMFNLKSVYIKKHIKNLDNICEQIICYWNNMRS